MKKILYIGNKLSGRGKTVTTIETLSKCLVKEGYVVNSVSRIENKGLRLLDMLYCVFRLRNGTDYVLIDTYSTSNFYFAFLCSQFCRLLKLKYIPILHGGNLPSRLNKSSWKSDRIFKNAYKNVSPSLYMMKYFKEYGYENLVYIPNSIEIAKYSFKKREFSNINLFWLRSFSELYNPNLAIDIVCRLKKKGLDVRLCMVGPENDGSLRRAKEYARNLDVDVEFTGKLLKEDWIELSKKYNIFINTTNFDNMPVSVLEAMALGLPVISTNVGGLPYLIESNKEGILVMPNRSEVFVEAIMKLYKDPERAIKMTKNARQKVEGFDWEVVKHKWTTILK